MNKTSLGTKLRLARYRTVLFLQRLWAGLIDRYLPCPQYTPVSASGLIASLNTKAPLQLCLASLERCRISPPLPLLIADNASSDGSARFLQDYACDRPHIQLILHPEIRWHGYWIDMALKRAESELLFVIDSDLLVFGQSLIKRCQAYMHHHPDCLILQADPWQPGSLGSGPDAPLTEISLSTWFLCIRTSLRDISSTSFVAVFPEQQQSLAGRKVMSDTGAKLIQDLHSKGRINAVHTVPRSWRPLFHHIGSLSWLKWADSKGVWAEYKAAQMMLFTRMARDLHPSPSNIS